MTVHNKSKISVGSAIVFSILSIIESDELPVPMLNANLLVKNSLPKNPPGGRLLRFFVAENIREIISAKFQLIHSIIQDSAFLGRNAVDHLVF